MKIINAMFSKVNGGLEQVFLNYSATLRQLGHQVIDVIHPKAEIKNSCSPDHLILLHNFNKHDIFAIRRLRKLIRDEKPDCIIMHSYRAAYLFKKTRTLVPKIAVCHVNTHYNFGADAIIALTAHMRQDIITAGHAANTVYVVPNMVPLPKKLLYSPPKQRPVPVIGVCARLSYIKGVDIVIEALAELKKRNVSFKANIAGDGQEKQACIQLIEQHQLQDDVQLLGWINDKASFYQDLDIFCLPSRQEAFGLVILESMMYSLPMVLTATSGPLEVIGDSNSAVFVPPADPYGLADGLERVICDTAFAQQLGAHAFQRVQHYSSDSVGKILQQTLETICHHQ